MVSSEVIYDEGFKPGYLGRMIQMQGEYYDVVWAVPGYNFECMMARQMCDFHDSYIPGRDLLLSAHVEGVMVGHVAVVSCPSQRAGVRLRWFHVEEKYQGRGIGRELAIPGHRLSAAAKVSNQSGFGRWTALTQPVTYTFPSVSSPRLTWKVLYLFTASPWR